MINITEKAATHIKEIAATEDIGYLTVRLKIIGSGCAGFTHDLYFDDQIGELDEVFELDGVKVIVDPMSIEYLDNSLIDYVEHDFGGAFKITNDKITGSCGCGSSVSY